MTIVTIVIMRGCHDRKVGLLETGNTVCLASGSKTSTGEEGGMNRCSRLNNGRQKNG